MVREIKFRSWQDNQMLTQPLSGVYGTARFMGFLYEDAKVMQYTGLLDKNGKEIYEGDIVSLNYGMPPKVDRLVIEYADDEVIADISVSGWWMRNVRPNGCSASLCKTYEGDLEIIGNIYENKELSEDEVGRE